MAHILLLCSANVSGIVFSCQRFSGNKSIPDTAVTSPFCPDAALKPALAQPAASSCPVAVFQPGPATAKIKRMPWPSRSTATTRVLQIVLCSPIHAVSSWVIIHQSALFRRSCGPSILSTCHHATPQLLRRGLYASDFGPVLKPAPLQPAWGSGDISSFITTCLGQVIEPEPPASLGSEEACSAIISPCLGPVLKPEPLQLAWSQQVPVLRPSARALFWSSSLSLSS